MHPKKKTDTARIVSTLFAFVPLTHTELSAAAGFGRLGEKTESGIFLPQKKGLTGRSNVRCPISTTVKVMV